MTVSKTHILINKLKLGLIKPTNKGITDLQKMFNIRNHIVIDHFIQSGFVVDPFMILKNIKNLSRKVLNNILYYFKVKTGFRFEMINKKKFSEIINYLGTRPSSIDNFAVRFKNTMNSYGVIFINLVFNMFIKPTLYLFNLTLEALKSETNIYNFVKNNYPTALDNI